MSAYSNIDADGLQSLQAEKHMLIDVRTDKEVERGLIPGALHIPLHTLPSRLADIAHDCPVVLYCRWFSCAEWLGQYLQPCRWLRRMGRARIAGDAELTNYDGC